MSIYWQINTKYLCFNAIQTATFSAETLSQSSEKSTEFQTEALQINSTHFRPLWLHWTKTTEFVHNNYELGIQSIWRPWQNDAFTRFQVDPAHLHSGTKLEGFAASGSCKVPGSCNHLTSARQWQSAISQSIRVKIDSRWIGTEVNGNQIAIESFSLAHVEVNIARLGGGEFTPLKWRLFTQLGNSGKDWDGTYTRAVSQLSLQMTTQHTCYFLQIISQQTSVQAYASFVPLMLKWAWLQCCHQYYIYPKPHFL